MKLWQAALLSLICAGVVVAALISKKKSLRWAALAAGVVLAALIVYMALTFIFISAV